MSKTETYAVFARKESQDALTRLGTVSVEPGVEVEDHSARYALLALQGPRAADILAPLTPSALGDLGYYRFAQTEVAGAPLM